MKKIIISCLSAILLLSMAIGFRQGVRASEECQPIVILYDNDVHCAVAHYATIAGLRDAIQASDTASCLLVSAGDFIQGGAIGMLTQGQDIITILNCAKYDVITLGNHEFDYGMRRCCELISSLDAAVSCVNLTRWHDAQPLYAPYVMLQVGTKKVAFIGVLTSETLIAERASFYDAEGKQIYDLNEQTVYDMVQRVVNKARREGADYVVALSHIGVSDNPMTSPKLIHATYGIDVVLDGHSHTVIEQQMETNKRGKPVILTQTGTQFQYIGKLFITPDGRMSTSLLEPDAVLERSERVMRVLDSIRDTNADLLDRPVATSQVALLIDDGHGNRQVRLRETNSGDFMADAFRIVADAEIGLQNGGGIRTSIPKGTVTYRQVLDASPFSNVLQVSLVKGSQLMQMLANGTKDVETGRENGFFPQVSGMCYTLHLQSPSFISDVCVMDPTTGQYEPLDTARYYRVALTEYAAREYDGCMSQCDVIQPYVCTDNEAIFKYLEILGNTICLDYAQPQGRIRIEP